MPVSLLAVDHVTVLAGMRWVGRWTKVPLRHEYWINAVVGDWDRPAAPSPSIATSLVAAAAVALVQSAVPAINNQIMLLFVSSGTWAHHLRRVTAILTL